MRIRWCGWASNPGGDVNRFPVGSTRATFRHLLTERECLHRIGGAKLGRPTRACVKPMPAPTASTISASGSAAAPRLTSLSHGGGCGCKISPAVLAELLKGSSPSAHFADLLVGTETSDDAAVYRVSDAQAIVATTDFFMPIVDDPVDFGRIAATNALSDIYAMGAKPLMALAIVGMPINTLSHESI